MNNQPSKFGSEGRLNGNDCFNDCFIVYSLKGCLSDRASNIVLMNEAVILIPSGKQMSNNYTSCFNRINFVVTKLPCRQILKVSL